MQTFIFPELAVMAPEILLPGNEVDLSRWSVIACDQFTSEPLYWTEVEANTAEVPSTSHMILPEVYLESLSAELLDKKITAVNESMKQYLSDGTLYALPPGFVLLSRSTPFHPSRKGLILAIDLDQYDFTPGNHMKIRATEGTVLSRIPPRMRIRQNALLELPHIMLLIDDSKRQVIEPAFEFLSASISDPLYDIDLMENGGHITGYFTPVDSSVSQGIMYALADLLNQSEDGFLFAVGDGNHSLATAKAHWDFIRTNLPPAQQSTHPARYALVEVVNIHDEGLDFEPIHRVAFGLTYEDFYASAGAFFADQGFHFLSDNEWAAQKDHFPLTSQVIHIVGDSLSCYLLLTDPKHSLAVGSLQNVLDHIVSLRSDVRLDYIHGEASVLSLAASGNLGFLLPPISKASFFETISAEGVFPRKTFSMGEAIEKRYYLEAKRITVKE
jgi:hypothetical protein